MKPRCLLAVAESPIGGGAEVFFARVVDGLRRSGRFEVVSAVPAENEGLTATLRSQVECDLRALPPLPTRLAGVRLHDPRRLRRLREAIDVNPFDAVLLNMSSPEHGASLVMAFGRSLPPTTALLHIAHSPREMGTRLGRTRGTLARLATRRVDAWCVLSSSAAEITRREWARPGAPIEIVRLPRTSARRVKASEARAQLGLPGGRLVGIAGRIAVAQKGHDVLVRAARRLIDHGEILGDLHFAVAGNGPDEGRVRADVAAAGLEDHFSFLGTVSPIDVFLSAIDVLAIPSNFEGVPLIGLEALELEVPGVVSDIPGLRDIWPAAWRVPCQNPHALADRLRALLALSSAERAAVAQKAHAGARDFVTDDPSSGIADVIDSIIPPRHERGVA